MHEWERQDKLLDKIEKIEIEDCLQYKQFTYEKQEWDNIPGIVPRYIIYLSKYMQGITAICHDFHSRETTQDLRVEIWNELAVTNSTFNNFNQNYELQK